MSRSHPEFGVTSVCCAVRVVCAASIASCLLTSAQAEVPLATYDKTFVTHHVSVIGGKRIRYTATVESTALIDDRGKAAVNFVSTDYVADGRPAPGRPVIFAFAGGPSGPSVAYHMRLLGPRQYIDAAAEDHSGKSPLRDNPDCLLDIADLVFVDPAETGFSRILPEGQRAYFYSVGGDASSIIQFMDKWLHEHHREEAPRYVMGGSYGSVRALRIAWDLKGTHPLDGVFMTADSLMLQEMVGVIGTVLPLPTMASTAVYYGKADRGGRSDAQIVDETYRFAINEYLPALARVQDLTEQSRSAMAQRLQAMVGIPAADILEHNLSVSLDDFRERLLRSAGRVLADPYDARRYINANAPRTDSDDGGLQSAFKQYLKDELHVSYDLSQYAMSAPGSEKNWDYKGPEGATREDGGNNWPFMLQAVLESNPHMFVYSANGLYDTKGVVGQVRWLMSRTQLPRERILVREYPGGHAVYADAPVAKLILQDLRGILTRSRAGATAR